MGINCYITFNTTYYAIRAEDILKGSTFQFKMVPVPRSISSSCGTALHCDCDEAANVEQLLKLHGVEYDTVHRVEEKELRLPLLSRFKKGE